jgi:hypothetical protein
MPLSRDDILNINDIQVKLIDVPAWKGKVEDPSLYIRQLSRGEQDEYLKRQYGATKMKQDKRAENQEITAINLYGHDAFLCVAGICDAEGKRLFTRNDIPKLEEKLGSAIGFIAAEIVKFSDMTEDIAVLDELKN